MDKSTNDKLDEVLGNFALKAIGYRADTAGGLNEAKAAIDALYQQKFEQAIEEAKPQYPGEDNFFKLGALSGVVNYESNLKQAWNRDEEPEGGV